MDQVRQNTRLAYFLMGLSALLFGAAAVVFTPDTVDVMFTFLAVFWIASGLVGIFGGIAGTNEHRWTAFFMGVLGVMGGVAALRMPIVALVVLMITLGFWALASGFSELFGALTLKQAGVANWFWTAFDGVLTVLLGIVMVWAPFESLHTLVWVTGIWAIVRGVLLIATGLTIPRNDPERPSVPAEAVDSLE